MTKVDPKVILYGAVGLGLLYVIWRASGAVGKAAGAVADGVVSAARTADTAASGAVSGIGSVFGLPTTGQTISDPGQVRWIIDNVGQMEASKWGTVMAYLKAQAMAPGSGTMPPGFSAWAGSQGTTSDQVSSTGTATRTGSNGTFAQGAAGGADPFGLGNYSTGSIFDVTGSGDQVGTFGGGHNLY